VAGENHAAAQQREWGQHPDRHQAAKKAQGVKLGGLNAKGIANRNEAKARAEALRPVLEELASMSSTAIAAELNARKIPTPMGRAWHAGSVIRIQNRLKGK
jgi:hypothetical protein